MENENLNKIINEVIQEIIQELIDNNLQFSYLPKGYKHSILDEKDDEKEN